MLYILYTVWYLVWNIHCNTIQCTLYVLYTAWFLVFNIHCNTIQCTLYVLYTVRYLVWNIHCNTIQCTLYVLYTARFLVFNIHFNRIQCTLYILYTVRYLVCNIHTVTWLTLIIKMYTSVCTASTVTIFNLHFAQVMYNARLIHSNNSRYAYCIYAILSMYVYKVYNSYLSGCRADDPINKRLRPSSPRGGLVHLYTHSTLGNVECIIRVRGTNSLSDPVHHETYLCIDLWCPVFTVRQPVGTYSYQLMPVPIPEEHATARISVARGTLRLEAHLWPTHLDRNNGQTDR